MNRSTAAFLIAFLFHLLLLLLIIFAVKNLQILPNNSHHETRMKISLKDFPLTKKRDEVGEMKPKIQPQIAPPLQTQSKLINKPLQKITPQPVQQQFHQTNINKPIQQNVQKTAPAVQTQQQTKTVPNLDKNTPVVQKSTDTTMKTDKNQPVKEHAKLYKFLSQADNSSPQQNSSRSSTQRSSQVDQDVKELYGAKFSQLSPGEQKYILDNMEIMRRITQETLNRVGRVNIPDTLRVNSVNIIEFNLHPNGDMTDFRFLQNSNYYILDDTTKETIEYAYSKYPRPQQTTLIRYKVYYNLRGN